MQLLSIPKPGRRNLVAVYVRLVLAAAITAVFVFMISSSGARSESGAGITEAPATCSVLVQNGSFEIPAPTPVNHPLNWTTPWLPDMDLARDDQIAHSGSSSIRISSPYVTHAWFKQEVTVEPETQYLLSGWIKTENVRSGSGANLAIFGTWFYSEGRFGTTDWTRVVVWFNSGPSTKVTIGARLGGWSPSSGKAWFDDLRLTKITPDGSRPSWKILVLIYDKTDAVVRGNDSVLHHYVGAMTQQEVEHAALVATQFVKTDIPALTSGNMIPELTIRYPDHPLNELEPIGEGWWPSHISTAPDRDPAFDSVIVIWDPRVVDEYTGIRQWIGTAAGLTPNKYADPAYSAIIIEATGYGHRNVFKHEWGHSILSYFEEIGVAPKPTVTNHTASGQYVHWPSGESYVWLDETDASPIPNSIYNNESGFTHDYYSGTTATADQPARRLGITPEAWSWGGPVTKPGIRFPAPPAITSSGDITVVRAPGTCWAWVPLNPPIAADACDLEFTPVPTRSDGQPWHAPFQCGTTVVTWTVTSSDNRTSSCEQVVTVVDEESPIFVNIPQPLVVNTGQDANACGTVVEDSRLVNTGAGSNPVVLDPAGDVYNPSDPIRNDIISTSATFDHESLTFTVSFADKIFSPWTGDPRMLIGLIAIDTDQNMLTGWRSAVEEMAAPDVTLGVDFEISLSSDGSKRGFVDIITRQPGNNVIVGAVPVQFSDTSFSITVPLAIIGNDNGLVNYGVGFWTHDRNPADRVPNGAVPATSVPVAGIMALDDCAAVTIGRSGVPANNLFPVGQTLITYTATDPTGNTASVTQTVTVVDNTLPVISNAIASPATLWPPKHDMVDVTVNYAAADNCGILRTNLSVSSNESGAESDWEIVDAHHVRLRAVRSARGGERLYTIVITAYDVHGNVSSRNVTVRVPRGNGRSAASDGPTQ